MKNKFALILLVSFICCYVTVHAQNYDTNQFNYNLTKSKDIQKIDGNSYYIHVVQPKQTLFSIAKLYEVTMDTICSINFLPSREINVGQSLKIPVVYSKNIIYNKSANSSVNETTENSSKISDIKSENNSSKASTNTSKSSVSNKKSSYVNEYEDRLNVLKSNKLENGRVKPITDKTFNVALLFPLYYENAKELDVDANNGQIISGTSKSFRFIQFYQGALIAVDSLTKRGMNVKLSVFDVDEKDNKALELVNNNSLKDMDLIIGPFYKNPYNVICKYAAEHNICIVNPTQSIKNTSCANSNSFKANVDNKLKWTYIANYIIDNYPNANIIIYTTDKTKDASNIDLISRLLSKSIPQRVRLQNFDIYNFLVDYSSADSTLMNGKLYDSISIDNKKFTRKQLQEHANDYTEFENKIKIFSQSVDGNGGYVKYLSGGRDNVIISFAKDYSHVLDNVNRLSRNSHAYKIHTFGDVSWTDYELDNKSLNNIDYHYCTNKMIDYKSNEVNAFIRKFSSEYTAEPNASQYAYLGFDTFYFFLNMLFYYDIDFPKHVTKFSYNGLESSFFFAPTDNAYGFENYYSNIYQIKKYEYKTMSSKDYIWNNIAIDLRSFIEVNH